MAGKDIRCLSSSDGGVSSPNYFQTDPGVSVSDVQGKKGTIRCSAMPESNGVWTTKDTSASPDYSSDRRWSGRDSWSVHKPLQLPLEDAIRHGNWLEARALVDKLLSVGTVQDIFSLEKLIKGEPKRPCERPAICMRRTISRVPCMPCSILMIIHRSLHIWPFPDRLAAVQLLHGGVPSSGVLHIPNNHLVRLQGILASLRIPLSFAS